MKGKLPGNLRTIALFLLFLFLFAVQFCITTASAYDAELQQQLPGQWILYDEPDDPGEGPNQTILALLILGEDGTMTLRCNNRDGSYAYSCNGSWSYEFEADDMDRIRLLFNATDNPAKAGSTFSVECVHIVYAEGWVENDTEYTALIFEDGNCTGLSPFEELCGYTNIALYKERYPNMQIVNCKNFVSLRESRSASSARLAKVPLGAHVLAFPEYGDENGFICCVYHDEYGYILSEYLQPVE